MIYDYVIKSYFLAVKSAK